MGRTDQSKRTEAPEAWRPVAWVSPEVTAKAEAAPEQRRNSKGLVLSKHLHGACGTCGAMGWTSPQEAGPGCPTNEHRPWGLPWFSFLSMERYLWREWDVLGYEWYNQPMCPLDEQAGTASRNWRGKVSMQGPGREDIPWRMVNWMESCWVASLPGTEV